jgi:hypothetical protein
MKYLKKYKLFEKSQYEFGCVMININIDNWQDITSYIESDDIYTKIGDDSYGIQDKPHLTLLYGLHDNVDFDSVKQIFDEFSQDINIEIDGIGLFQNKDYDVVKLNVKPDDGLQYLHDKLSELPNSNSFPDYKPHITICYVKSGKGEKYTRDDYKYRVKNINKIWYSAANGENFYFEI